MLNCISSSLFSHLDVGQTIHLAAKSTELTGSGNILNFSRVCHFPMARPQCWTQSTSASKNDTIPTVSEREMSVIQDERSTHGIRIRRFPPGGDSVISSQLDESLTFEGSRSPQNILEEIIWNKTMEVSQLKERHSLSSLMEALGCAPVARDFLGALKASYSRTGLPALIAEVKKASPSRGILRQDFDPVTIACAYEKGGAACLSVLTDEKYFEGSFNNLEAIRKAGVKCPLLCKEFIIDAWQLYYARLRGADAVLLIAAVLLDDEIRSLIKVSKELHLTALVEVHDEKEMERVLEIEGIQLVGINNRNLETFDVDIHNTQILLSGRHGLTIHDKGIMVVAESGLFTPNDIAYVQEAGVQAVLVGESIVKQADPREGIHALFGRNISSC